MSNKRDDNDISSGPSSFTLPIGAGNKSFKVEFVDKATDQVLLYANYKDGKIDNIRMWDETSCKHENVQEVLLLNFTVKHCKDCGREVK